MIPDVITDVSLSPVSEVISQLMEAILETVVAANEVLVEKDSFMELKGYLERILPILKELNSKSITHLESLDNTVDILNREVKVAKQLTLECCKRNKVYLLINCRSIAKRLENTTREIGHALGLIPLSLLDHSLDLVEEISKLCDNMNNAEFKTAVAGEQILKKIESGIQERNANRSYANNLLALIAEAVGIPAEQSALKKEFDEFKSEIENARLRKDQAEAIQMDQIIALLERADATSTPQEKEIKYFTKRESLGSLPLEPLQSFYCPITQDVMVDPVETSSGQTFEREAIEKWFADGNSMCPLTMIPLDTSVLRPNKTLRQSIEEWKDRNTMITIASMRQKLLTEEEDGVLHCLDQLQDLCVQKNIHREWVVLENYIPVLVGLLGPNPDIRNRVLVILRLLAEDSDDAKDRVSKADKGIESIVRSLGRRITEGKLAVALLLELSKSDLVRDQIGKVQGCIFLLVTMSGSDDDQAARDAQKLLKNLSFSEENVIQMAKANNFNYLLQRLSSGTEDVKMMMATTLAEMELTENNKLTLVESGVLKSLLPMVSHVDLRMKKIAVRSLYNLSNVPKNGQKMIREGAVALFLDILQHHTSSSELHEQVAATISHLAMSTMSQETGRTLVSLFESDEDIFKLFSLITLRGSNVQQSILQAFYVACQSPFSKDIKIKLTQAHAAQVLVHFCELENEDIWPNSVKLLFCLTENNDLTMEEHVRQKTIENLLKIVSTSSDEEVVASAMGIISNLPDTVQISEWLLDAEAIPIISRVLHDGNHNGPHENQLVENAVGAVCRLSIPSNQELQMRAAKAGLISLLVKFLQVGTILTKKRAAISLAQFSKNSFQLCKQIRRSRGFLCFSPPSETGCPVHRGICTVESSFCLVEADALGPLVRLLADTDLEAREASLDALLTLIAGPELLGGIKLLAEANAIIPIIRLLSSPSAQLQEKALTALEKIFRFVDFRQKYGTSAHMSLVDITQRGSSGMKSLAARVLAHMDYALMRVVPIVTGIPSTFSYTINSVMNQLKQIHAYTLRTGVDRNKLLLTKLLEIPNLPYALKLFDHIPQRTVFLYNKLIQACLHHGPHNKCLSLYSQMCFQGYLPNEHTFTFVFSACAGLSSPLYGQMIHCQFLKSGFVFDLFALTALVDMYAKLGLLVSARRQFDEMEVRDIPTWNSLIAGYARRGDLGKAKELFDRMSFKNVVSWTSMISGYSQNGHYMEALSMFLRMEKEKEIRPNEVTLASVLPACANLGALEVGERIEAYARENGFLTNLFVSNALLEMYGRCGRIDQAKRFFKEIGKRRNLCTWNSMIMSLAVHGKSKEALDHFHQMLVTVGHWDGVAMLRKLMKTCHMTKAAGYSFIEEGDQIRQFIVEDKSHSRSNEIYAILNDLLLKMVSPGLVTDLDCEFEN
ncbi:Pentatricopeptide repeat [Dillenia turbinata]|uniref:Protein unc-45 homolog B n=1 Tax=Dillenia turbinata TaxID=194707 RepID=A0AAN8UZR6_9MAGN